MGLGSVLGNIGRRFMPQVATTSIRTPSFLPEDEYNQPYDDGSGAADDSQQGPPQAARPPISAASQMGGNAPPPALIPRGPLPTPPPPEPDFNSPEGGASLPAPAGMRRAPAPPVAPSQPTPQAMPQPPAPPNTPGGQKIGIGRQIGGALIQGAGALFPPAAGAARVLGQSISQGSFPEKELVYQRQMAAQKAQADLQKEQATAEETKQRGRYFGAQADELDANGKRAPAKNIVAFGKNHDGLFDASSDGGGRVLREPTVSDPADYIEIAPDKAKALGLQPQKDGTYRIPKEGIGPFLTSQMKPAAAPTAESEKIKFQSALGKLNAEGVLAPDAMADSRKVARAIDGSRTLSPQEKNEAKAYLAANATPGATGAAATIRVEGMGAIREMPVIDTKRGNALQYLNANEINKANQTEPGRYIPTGPGQQALNKTALLEDIRGSINQTRESLAAIPEFTAMDKGKIAVAMRDRDPKSAISQLVGGAAGASMTPAQQEYLINLAQLHEQALAMRSVLGAGQGSDDLRAAIIRTIPGPSTPNKAYALKQLNAFEQTLGRLSRGVPTVPLREATGTQATAPQGGTVHYVDAGVSYDIPADKVQKFISAHPNAKQGQ